MSGLVEVEVPTKGSGVEEALFCFKKFSLRLLLQRLELGLIRFFHRSGGLGYPGTLDVQCPWRKWFYRR